MKLNNLPADLFCREGKDVDAGTETNVNLYHELHYHFVGTDQSEDILCWKDSENPKSLFEANVTDDGKVSRFIIFLAFTALTFLLSKQ